MRKKIIIIVLLFAALLMFMQFGGKLTEALSVYRLAGQSEESVCAEATEATQNTVVEGIAACESDANAKESDVAKTFRVISCTPEETVLEFTLPEYNVEDVTDENGRTWQFISTDDTDNLNWRGLPSVPSYRLEYGSMPGEVVEAILVDGEYRILENTVPVPATGPIVQGQSTTEVPQPSSAVYGAGVMFPANNLEVASTYQIRGIQGQGVQVSPFQYDDATSSVRTLTKGTIVLKTTGSIAAVSDSVGDFAQLQERHFINSDSFRSASKKVVGTLAIVLPDQWRDNETVASYIDWKRKNGWRVVIGGYPSETGEGGAEIRDWIAEAYSNEGVSHLMLLGDYGVLPPYQHSTKRLPNTITAGDHQFIATDTPYALLAGEDDLSYMDVMMGRVPVSSISLAENYLQRMMLYERGEFVETEWTTSGIYIGSIQNATRWPYATIKDYEHMLHKRQALEDAAIMADGTEFFEKKSGQMSQKGSEVAAAFNKGASLAMYLGHGACHYYETTLFSAYEASHLDNSGMLPFVVAPVCDTGNLDHSTSYDFICSIKNSKSLGQSYFESKTPTAGVSGVLCASNLVSWNPPLALFDEITECLTASQSDERISSMGAYALAGIMRAVVFCDTYEADFKASVGEPNHISGGYTKDFGIYHAWCLEFLGDPTAVTRIGPQNALEVEAEFTAKSLEVSVNGFGTASPVANCFVAAECSNGEIISACTASNGKVSLNISPENLGSLTLRVLDGSGSLVKRTLLLDEFENEAVAEWLDEWDKAYDPEASNAEEMLAQREAVLKAWRETPSPPERPSPKKPSLEKFTSKEIIGHFEDCKEIRDAISEHGIAVMEATNGKITMLLDEQEAGWLGNTFREQELGYEPVQCLVPSVTSAQIREYLSALSYDYWPRMRITTLGYSASGSAICGLRISLGGEDENLPQLLITAGLHGNESRTVEKALALLGEAVDALDDATNPLNALLKNHVLWIVPLLNPDAYDKGRFLNENNADLEYGYPKTPASLANGDATGIFEPWNYSRIDGVMETCMPQPEQCALVRWLSLHQIDRTVYLREGIETNASGTLASWQKAYLNGAVAQCFKPTQFNLCDELNECSRLSHEDVSYLPGVPLTLTIPEATGTRVVRVVVPSGWHIAIIDDDKAIFRSGDGYIDCIQESRALKILITQSENVNAEAQIVITAYAGEDKASLKRILVAPLQEKTHISLKEGWNYFSVPLAGIMPQKLGAAQLLICRDGIYWSLGMNAPLEAGRGYVAYAATNTEIDVVGSRVDAAAFSCGTGAQLMGTVSEHSQPNANGMYSCGEDGQFRLMNLDESMQPLKAYWLWTETPRQIVP